jgi:hypothetical protein
MMRIRRTRFSSVGLNCHISLDLSIYGSFDLVCACLSVPLMLKAYSSLLANFSSLGLSLNVTSSES